VNDELSPILASFESNAQYVGPIDDSRHVTSFLTQVFKRITQQFLKRNE